MPKKQYTSLAQENWSLKKQPKKCQPAVRDTPGPLKGPHPTLMGVGVPDSRLTRPKKSSMEWQKLS